MAGCLTAGIAAGIALTAGIAGGIALTVGMAVRRLRETVSIRIITCLGKLLLDAAQAACAHGGWCSSEQSMSTCQQSANETADLCLRVRHVVV